MPNQDIKCNIENCKFNNHDHMCTLTNIVVGSDNGDNGNVCEKCDTECASFEMQ